MQLGFSEIDIFRNKFGKGVVLNSRKIVIYFLFIVFKNAWNVLKNHIQPWLCKLRMKIESLFWGKIFVYRMESDFCLSNFKTSSSKMQKTSFFEWFYRDFKVM